MVRTRRLGREHIEAGSSYPTVPQCREQRGFVDDASARGIDEDGIALHCGELCDADEIARLRCKRQMQADHVRIRQHAVKRHPLRPDGRRVPPLSQQDVHSECLPDPGHRLS